MEWAQILRGEKWGPARLPRRSCKQWFRHYAGVPEGEKFFDEDELDVTSLRIHCVMRDKADFDTAWDGQ
jgi:hypothetical protein